MRFVCVDKTASDRLRLQQYIESAYEQCRAALGHVRVPEIVPASKEEVTLSATPDFIALGPGFALEEAYTSARELRTAFAQTTLFVILPGESYSLRALRRFEKVANDVFSPSDSPMRLIHGICRAQDRQPLRNQGSLLIVDGVKGGIGTTSVVSGLAHAAETLGKRSVVIDLSLTAALLQYLASPRWQSADYTVALSDGLPIERSVLERMLSKAPSGITALLPPAGGNDVREMWLRDSSRFEHTLSLVETLKEMFDLVLVDLAAAEGVLPFALCARANHRLIVSSNEAAAVHLLSRKLRDCQRIPGECAITLAINALITNGLTEADIRAYLSMNKRDLRFPLRTLPYDGRASGWIGTGNTFYTEGNRKTQRALEDCLAGILDPSFESTPWKRISVFASLHRRLRGVLRGAQSPTPSSRSLKLPKPKPPGLSILKPTSLNLESDLSNLPAPVHSTAGQVLYRAPKPISESANSRPIVAPSFDPAQFGSFTFEYALFVSCAAAAAALSLPIFLRHFGGYLAGFHE
ncbi:MAG: cellulose synthase operon protein YhjQ/BcsQ [Bdellovibrionota bacterium]